MAQQNENNEDLKSHVFWFFIGNCLLYLFSIGSSMFFQRPEESWESLTGAFVLLGIPMASITFLLYLEDKNLQSYMKWHIGVLTIPLYLVTIFYFCLREDFFCYLILLVVIIGLWMTIGTTCVILHHEEKEKDKLYESFIKYKFKIVCMFVVNFLSITYLLALAVGFHDSNLRKHNHYGLYVNPQSLDGEKFSSEKYDSKTNGDKIRSHVVKIIEDEKFGAIENFEVSNGKIRDEYLIKKFNTCINELYNNGDYHEKKRSWSDLKKKILDFVEENSENLRSIIKVDESLSALKESLKKEGIKDETLVELLEILRSLYNSDRELFERILFVSNDKDKTIPVGMMHSNGKEKIESIVKFLSKSGNNDRFLVTIVGKANERIIFKDSTKFKSNYEISEYRALLIKEMIINNLLKNNLTLWPNLEWQIFPVGEEGFKNYSNSGESAKEERKTISEKNDINKSNVDNKNIEDPEDIESPSVDVWITETPNYVLNKEVNYFNSLEKETRGLNLLENLYFMIYTITTTGYGDILPASAFTKFVTSIANILEVFFIVIFFNALLAIQPPPPETKTPPSEKNSTGSDGSGGFESTPGKDIDPTDMSYQFKS